MSKEVNVLINTPDLNLPGGVAYFYKTVKPYFSVPVSYFHVGRRASDKSRFHVVKRLFGDYLKFIGCIRKFSPDIIHLNPSLGAKSFVRESVFIAIALLHKKKVIVFFRGWDEDYAKYSRKYLKWLYKLTYFRCNAIIVLASEFKNSLRNLGYENPVYLETTVVGDDIFRADYKYENNTGVIEILFLSRIEKAKGIYELIDTIRILNGRGCDVRLKVAGSGAEKEASELYAKSIGVSNIEFLGHITGEQKQQAFDSADIFAFPTYYGEGMPNAVLEAMAYGLPVLTRPVGGLADFFEDETMGCLVSDISATIYAEKLEKLVNDFEYRRKISVFNRKFAENRFKASEVVKRLESIYQEVGR